MNTPIWVVVMGYATKVVLVVLVLLSVWSVYVILDRRSVFKILQMSDADWDRMQVAISSSSGVALKSSPKEFQDFTNLLTPTGDKKSTQSVEEHFRALSIQKRIVWSRGLPILATLGSNAPFIGLFGTVLGIIQSFGTLASDQSSMNQVILSLAEALIATAIGLFVAIPALIAYNYFQNQLKTIFQRLESLKSFYLARS